MKKILVYLKIIFMSHYLIKSKTNSKPISTSSTSHNQTHKNPNQISTSSTSHNQPHKNPNPISTSSTSLN